MSGPRALLADNDRTNLWLRRLAVVVGILVLALQVLTSIGVLWVVSSAKEDAAANRVTGDLLVDCTTPSTPDEPHTCWDRLRSGDSGTSDAVRRLYCVPLVLDGYRPPECADVAAAVASLPRS